MNINSWRAGALVAAMATGGPVFGQSLDEFLQHAAQANVDARLSKEATVRASADHGAAWGGLLPSLTANGGYTRNQYEAVVELPDGPNSTKQIVITPYNQLDATFKVELPLIDATKWLRAAATKASADAAERRQQGTLHQVQRQVIAGYYGYASAVAVRESAEKSLKAAQSQLEVTKARASAGVANELDLARAVAEVERNQQALADAETVFETQARSLRTLTGLEPRQVPRLPSDDLHAEPPEGELLGQLEQLPEVSAADRDVVAANRATTAAGLALVPTVNGQYTQRFTNATGFQGANALYSAGVNFSWRLDLPAAQALRSQQSNGRTAALNAERARQQAQDQLHSDWLKVRASLTKVRSTTAQVDAAQRAASLAHERYGAGVATQLDVIQAERDLFTAEVSHIQARGELANARAALRLSANLPLQGSAR